MITAENVRELFDYEDGRLYWKIRPACAIHVGDEVGRKINNLGYRVFSYKGKDYAHHRVIFLWNHGYKASLVDHIDQDKLNNRIENLREASKSLNAINSNLIRGEVGYRGVSLNKSAKIPTYQARIKKNYKEINLGCFATAEEASAAYEEARRRLF